VCTVSWLSSDRGFLLLANRDELRRRSTARPPRRYEPRGERPYLAPLDPDGGGTWISINQAGVGLALLNDYAAPQGAGDFESRGRLVARLATVATSDEAASGLRRLDLESYRPFRLVIVAPGTAARIHHWDGSHSVDETPGPLALVTSSSFDPSAVDSSRRELLERHFDGGSTRQSLEAFHCSHRPERGPLSPCMHRADASTVSRTRLAVVDSRVLMSYLDGPPCDPASRETVLTLPLETVDRTARA
jgi:hypothetical protein